MWPMCCGLFIAVSCCWRVPLPYVYGIMVEMCGWPCGVMAENLNIHFSSVFTIEALPRGEWGDEPP